MRIFAMVLTILMTMCTCTETSLDVSATIYKPYTLVMEETEECTVIRSVEDEVVEQVEYAYDLNEDDKYLLAKIMMAEAEGEDLEGKALVGMVVLNRMDDNRFPDTIEGVIFQENQFSPINDGRWDRVEPNDECWEAIELIINGWDKSEDALYFESCPSADNWHSQNLNYLFDHGCHRFYN